MLPERLPLQRKFHDSLGSAQKSTEIAGCFQSKLPLSTITPPIAVPWPPMNLVAGMNDDICTILNRANQVRSCKCRINYKRNVMFVRNFCNFFNINQVGVRFPRVSIKIAFCVFLDCSFERAFCIRIYKCCSDAAGLKSMCQKVVGSAVDGLGSYNVLTCFCKCLECIIDSCCTGSVCKRCLPPSKSSNSLLENILCRVGKSSINISGIAKSETVSCML